MTEKLNFECRQIMGDNHLTHLLSFMLSYGVLTFLFCVETKTVRILNDV